MKLMKSMKQLKFWSRTKTRKKFLQYHKLAYDHYYHPTYYNPPPPPTRPPPPPPPPPQPEQLSDCECHFCEVLVVEPSAPPLPSWLEAHEYEGYWSQECEENDNCNEPGLEVEECESGLGGDGNVSGTENETLETCSVVKRQDGVHGNVSGTEEETPETCLVVKRQDGGSGKLFGCVGGFGGVLFRCLFPCFCVSDDRKLLDKVV